MHQYYPQLFPIACIFVALIRLPASLAQVNEQYLNCIQTFECGKVKGIGYPFWGAQRSQSCGHPSFQLNCTGDAPVLTIQTRPYRVLAIDKATSTLTVVRQEFWNNNCPQNLFNATAILDTDHFKYADDAGELYLHYGCKSFRVAPNASKIVNQFSCLPNGSTTEGEPTEGTFAFYAFTVLTDTDVLSADVSCNTRLSVMVNSTVRRSLLQGNSTTSSSANVSGVLESGVGLMWEANNDDCKLCIVSGGVCGSSNSSNPGSFVCHCSDRDHAASCTTTESKKNLGKLLGIVIGSIFGVVAVTTLGLFCYFEQNRSGKLFTFWDNQNEVHANLEAILNNCGSFAPKRYSYSEVKKMTNSFEEKLGQGGYGQVYKGKLKDGSLVAVKVLKESKGNGEEFFNEVTSISRTAHVNIVTLLGFCFEGRKRALIYEFMPNGSLDKFTSGKNTSVEHQLGWGTLYQIAIGIARGLEYLHRGCNTRILHFDIKPHNILLDEGFCPKISDFGLAKLCPNKSSIISMQDRRGTTGYIAPEVFSRIYGGVSHKSDVYSYGMMIIDMVGLRNNVDLQVDQTTEYFPDWIYRRLELTEEIEQHSNMDEEETTISRKMMTVGLWCIQIDPSSRPAMTKVVEMLEGSLVSLQIPPRPFAPSVQKAVLAETSTTYNIDFCSQIQPRPFSASLEGKVLAKSSSTDKIDLCSQIRPRPFLASI